MRGLALHVLGAFEATLDGKSISGFKTEKARALLAYLAVERGRPHRRQSLVGLLWPDYPESSARANLRQVLTNLRQVLKDEVNQTPYLLVEGETIQLNPESDFGLDVEDFERLSASAASENLEAAIALYRGGFLEGFSLKDSPDFDHWTASLRERYLRQASAVLGKLGEQAAQDEAYEKAIAYAHRRLALEPWQEEAHQQLMRLLALNGQRAAALAQYEACCKVLHEELGVEPSLETRRLQASIRAGDITGLKPEKARRHNLPAQLTSCIGREKEIAQVKDLLAADRLVTLTGAGGVGKTRLAIQVAGEVVELYPDGVWYVELAPLVDPVLIPTTVAKVLGLHEQFDRDILDVLLDFLKHKHTLLVLDNCEHILDGCIRLADALLTRCPDLKILTASREALGIGGEMTCRVLSLSFPDPVQQPPPDQLMEWDAVRLFVERARAVQPDFQVTSDNAPAVAQICQRLDGIPLALELAAARLDVLTPEQVAAKLKDAFRLLTGGSRTALERHQTLRATIDWSYNLLTAKEKILLHRLAVFAGGWTLEAAEQGCSGEPIAVEDVFELLTSLVHKSMATPDQHQGGERRYYLLEMVRQYAREKLAESGEGEAFRQRHLDYYHGMTHLIEETNFSGKHLIWISRLKDELDNFRAAIEWAFREEGDVQTGLFIAHRVGSSLAPHGYMVEALNWLRRGQAHPGYLEQVQEAEKIRIELALATHFGLEWVDRKHMVKQLEQLGSRAEALGPTAQALRRYILAFMGFCFSYEGNFTRSKQLIAEALGSSYEKEPPSWELAYALLYKAVDALFAGEHTCAIEAANLCIKNFQELGDRWDAAYGIIQLGQVEALQGNTVKAKVHFNQSLDLFQGANHLKGTNLIFNYLGQLAMLEGDYVEAVKLSQEAIGIAESYGNHMDAAWGLWCIAKAQLVQSSGMPFPEGEVLRRRAATLLGVTRNLEEHHGWRTYSDLMPNRPPTMWDTISWIDTSELQAALEQGQVMPFDEAVKYTLSV